MTDTDLLPTHVGYIVDGNRRWAKSHNLEPKEGHLVGYEKIKEVLLATCDKGISYASVYVFSTENWRRSKAEVKWLMNLVVKMFTEDIDIFIEKNIRLRIAGTGTHLPMRVKRAISRAERATKNMTGSTVVVCFNYGGHQEIIDAINKMRKVVSAHKKITTKIFEQFLYTPDVPPCDVIVRTSGEQRLSNFMLWRSAYSELFFLEKEWPDITTSDIDKVLDEYISRSRRFGG